MDGGRPVGVRSRKYRLRGSLLNLGLLAAARLCERFEDGSHRIDDPAFPALIERLEELYRRSYEEFSRYLQSA